MNKDLFKALKKDRATSSEIPGCENDAWRCGQSHPDPSENSHGEEEDLHVGGDAAQDEAEGAECGPEEGDIPVRL